MRTGELARLTGISPDTLRHYERLGLLPPPERSAGNYRLYGSHAVERLKLIRNGLAMGVTLADMSRLLKARDGGGAPGGEARRLARETLGRVDRQIGELVRYRDELSEVLAEWDRKLRRASRSRSRARLLLDLAPPPSRPDFHRACPARERKKG